MIQLLKLKVPENYKNNIRSFRWLLNGQELSETSAGFRHTFTKADKYTLQAQIVVYCDTCPNLLAKCTIKDILIEAPKILTALPDQPNSDRNTNSAKNKNTKSSSFAKAKNKKQSQASDPTFTVGASENASDPATALAQSESEKKTAGPSLAERAELNEEDNFISAEELVACRWNKEAPRLIIIIGI